MAKRSSPMQRAADMCVTVRQHAEEILGICGALKAGMESKEGLCPRYTEWAIRRVVGELEFLLDGIDEIRSDIDPTPRPITMLLQKRRKQEAPA